MERVTRPEIHAAPSIGGLVKKMIGINPDLSVEEIIGMIREATRAKGAEAGEYADTKTVDERIALDLARQTLAREHHSPDRQKTS
jgi:hypothetical protein